MTITYLETPFTVSVKRLWWQEKGLRQTATGYGRKLTTEYMLHRTGERALRVYAVCFSNVASFYVLIGGKALYVRDWQLEEARDNARVA